MSTRELTVRYLGFRSTERGREYTMHVSGADPSRDFVLLISHQSFSRGETRFQDGPDVCSARLRRELAADPTFAPSNEVLITAEDLLDYRNRHNPPVARRRAPVPGGA
jgi:hypothetical protein